MITDTVRLESELSRDRAQSCDKCGQEYAGDARYCSGCGAPLPSQIELEAKKKRFELYKRDDIRRFISWALKSSDEVRPQRNSETGDYSYAMLGENPLKIISDLESINVLEKFLIDTVPSCPSCQHSNFYIDYLCPVDKHRGLTRGIMIEHYACAYTDFEANFKSGDDLKCPKCKRILKLIGTDYRKIDKIYNCPACGKFFNTPLIELTCRMCDKVTRPDEVMMQQVYAYRVRPEARSELLTHCSLETPILRLMERQGITVTSPKTLRGLSGIEHSFDMYGLKDGTEFVLDIVSATADIGPESVVGFFAKVYDTKPPRAILVVMPNITKETQRLCSMYGIEVVAGKNADEIIERLMVLLTRTQPPASPAHIFALNALK